MLFRLLQLRKAFSPMNVTEFGMVTDDKLLQSQKASLQILVTEFGMVMEVRLLQPLKVEFQMHEMLDGMFTDFKLLQPENAPFSISTTEEGIVIEIRSLQSAKAPGKIHKTLDGITNEVNPLQFANPQSSITVDGIVEFLQPATNCLPLPCKIALQLSRESKTGLLLSTTIFVRLAHSPKTLRPILLTLAGIYTDVKPLPKKALSPMLVTLDGKTVFLQPRNRLLSSVFMIALQLSRESYTGLLLSTEMLARLLHPKKASPAMLETLEGMFNDTILLQP